MGDIGIISSFHIYVVFSCHDVGQTLRGKGHSTLCSLYSAVREDDIVISVQFSGHGYHFLLLRSSIADRGYIDRVSN